MKKTCKEWDCLSDHYREVIEINQKRIPVPVGKIAKELGLDLKVNTLEVGISGMIEPCSVAASGFKITINKHEVKSRQRFTVCHEIAHYLLHKQYIGLGLKDNVLFRSSLSDEKETEANRLASWILIPRDALSSRVKDFGKASKADYINALCAEFEVSEEAMRIALGIK